ncbi:polyprenyl synthetase family protein [Clostridium sp. DJ247]|uniref:polyprenyl synthetase family protein n=1 Tax=Clostridium sp. DJ247 TaxID=2726188 RepID=UPI00162791BE|nr:polyprenyl synthetase family protein [Clostridium sp. DJ247]MBC2580410.1 polyprenyl synthetase family protein [Clostridium sp. DJ247]
MLKEKSLLKYFNRDLAEIKKIAKDSLENKNSTTSTLINDLPIDNGKMLRAIFVLIGGGFGKIDKDKLKRISAAIEILHLATLVHDDIIDESNIRRGKRSIQSSHGVKAALFTGDYLFSTAFSLLSKNSSPKTLLDVSETIKLICSAEVNQFFSLYSFNSTIKDYLRRINGKCASLFSLSLSIGAYESNAEPGTIAILKSIGYYTGMAFQLIDDLLDITSSKATIGKPSGNDIKSGVYTLPVLYEFKKRNKNLIKCIEENNIIEAVNVLKNSEGLEKSRATAKKYTYKSLDLISKLPNVNEKQLLAELVENLVLREY